MNQDLYHKLLLHYVQNTKATEMSEEMEEDLKVEKNLMILRRELVIFMKYSLKRIPKSITSNVLMLPTKLKLKQKM